MTGEEAVAILNLVAYTLVMLAMAVVNYFGF